MQKKSTNCCKLALTICPSLFLPDFAALCRNLYDTFMHLLLPDYPSWKVMSALRPGTTLSAIDVLTSRRNSTGCAVHVGYGRVSGDGVALHYDMRICRTRCS